MRNSLIMQALSGYGNIITDQISWDRLIHPSSSDPASAERSGGGYLSKGNLEIQPNWR
jgi:hypothetical protein